MKPSQNNIQNGASVINFENNNFIKVKPPKRSTKRLSNSQRLTEAAKKNKGELCEMDTASNPASSRPSSPTMSVQSFCTPNPFAALEIEKEVPLPERINIPKPPPIFIKRISNYSLFCTELSKRIGLNSFECKSRVNNIILLTKTVESYRIAIKYLQEMGAEYHTYQVKQEKSFRVVLRNLHSSIPTSDIKNELQDKGFQVRSVTNVRHPSTKIPLPLFFVDLEPDTNNKEIFSLKSLVYTKVQVEEPYKITEIIQCKRCQQYGHSRSYCNYKPRCVKCAGSHASSECAKPKEDPPTCALCHGSHPASYRGCITHRELQRLRRKSFQDRTATRAPETTVQQKTATTSTHSDFPQVTSPPKQVNSHPFTNRQASYAEVLGSPQPQSSSPVHSPISSDLTTLLTSFISEFKSLISPLISLLTSVVSNLIPKISP